MDKVSILEGRRLYRGDTGEVVSIGDVNELFNALFETRSICFVEDLADEFYFRFMDECVNGPHSSVVCTKRGSASGVRIKHGREVRWIGVPSKWGDYHADSKFASFIGRYGAYTGLGIRPTPSSAGIYSMQRTWSSHNIPRYSATNGIATYMLHKYMGGPRFETPGIGFGGTGVYYDQVSAYLCHWGCLQPVGTSYSFKSERGVVSYVDYFANCLVHVRDWLCLGPFRSSNGDGRSRALYPREPGTYEAHLWKGEVEDCREAGCEVKILGGIGWKDQTTLGRLWSEDMFELRWDAPDEEIADAVKITAVSAIGRHASNGRYYVLVPEHMADICDVPVIDKYGRPHHWFVHEVVNPNPHALLHWYAKTVAECNRSLYRFALPFAEQGRLLATNADGVIVSAGDEHKGYVRKYSADYISVQPGTWVYTFLTNLVIRRSRWIESDQMVRRPGYKKNGSKVQVIEEENGDSI